MRHQLAADYERNLAQLREQLTNRTAQEDLATQIAQNQLANDQRRIQDLEQRGLLPGRQRRNTNEPTAKSAMH